jgi:hypothetical protein
MDGRWIHDSGREARSMECISSEPPFLTGLLGRFDDAHQSVLFLNQHRHEFRDERAPPVLSIRAGFLSLN